MRTLSDTPDLYGALRASGVAPGDLPTLLAGCSPAVQDRLARIDQGLLRAILRAGLGGAAIPTSPEVTAHLAAQTPAPLFAPDVATSPTLALLSNGQHPDMPAFSDHAFDAWFAARGVPYGIGLYGEDRAVYRSPQFADTASAERRTRHLGIDVFAPAGTPVHAPLPGIARHVTYQSDPLDYGHCLILEHSTGSASFFTLYGHLGPSLSGLIQPGDPIAQGQLIAHLGDWPHNGGWAPHIHFQIMTDLLEQTCGNFFGVGHASLWDIWTAVCPDPNLILRLPPSAFQL